MSLSLFEHNQTAYEAAVSMLEEKGRAAVIHPTGTGKSFLAFKLASDHPEAAFCWLAPSEYIYRTQVGNLKKAMPPGEEADVGNIRFLTYSRLMKMGGQMEGLCPDYIILDEFHRCGASEWGRSVRKLLAAYPRAKVLGLSATSIRYLDNQRDMAQELFGGDIASQMTLGEAIARGILPAPRYVTALYSYEKEFRELEQRVKAARREDSDGSHGKPDKEGYTAAGSHGSAAAHPVDTDKDVAAPGHTAAGSHGSAAAHPVDMDKDVAAPGHAAAGDHGIAATHPADTGRGAAAPGQPEELLEQLRRALEQADGMDQVFWRHMEQRHGRYLVFCADKDHMEEMKGHTGEWFRLVDAEPHIYTAYYDSPETARDFAAFQADDSRHLKLLFCIDMLNEGVHVEGVDGVILLRPTVSPILYLQQVGRALSAGTSGAPVIFDLVDNFDSLSCITYLEQEIEEAFSLMPCTHGERERFRERFRVTEEARDCRLLFGQLQKVLSSPWETYYQAAREWHREKGSLRIPKSYVTPSGLSLGSWLQTQRRVRAGSVPGALTEEKIGKLDAIGMVWDVRAEGWEEGCGELRAYYERHGDVDVKARYRSDTGFPLGKWVSNLRAAVRKKGLDGALSPVQQRQLEELGMVWDKERERWERYLRAAEGYRSSHGDLKVPAKYVTPEGLPLGSWLHALRSGTRREALAPQQREQLEALGIRWEKEGTALWERKYGLAKAYYEEHGDLDIPVAYCVEGVRLGRWISTLRTKRRRPGSSGMLLDEERIRQLDRIGMDWKG